MKRTNGQKGITLVALVITIIILLILAGITITSLTNTGLFGKAQEAKEKTQAAERNQAETSTTGNATTVNNGIVIEDATTGATLEANLYGCQLEKFTLTQQKQMQMQRQ